MDSSDKCTRWITKDDVKRDYGETEDIIARTTNPIDELRRQEKLWRDLWTIPYLEKGTMTDIAGSIGISKKVFDGHARTDTDTMMKVTNQGDVPPHQ